MRAPEASTASEGGQTEGRFLIASARSVATTRGSSAGPWARSLEQIESYFMTAAEKKKFIAINAALWIVAILLAPLTRLIPTGSGSPPKIFELLIPMLILLLAVGSTFLLSAGIGKPKNE